MNTFPEHLTGIKADPMLRGYMDIFERIGTGLHILWMRKEEATILATTFVTAGIIISIIIGLYLQQHFPFSMPLIG